MSDSAIQVLTQIFAIYNLLLIVVSIVFNPIVLLICVRSKKLRSTSTFKLIAFSAINDLLTSIVWNLESFTDTFFELNLYFRSIIYCRWMSVFFQYTTSQLESWLLVTISVDRLFSLTFKNWSKHLFKAYRPVIFSFLLALIIIGINLNEVFTIGYTYRVNGTEIVACYQTRPNEIDFYQIMSKVLLYFGFIVPYGLLVLSNMLIIYKATSFDRSYGSQSHASGSSRKRKAHLTRTILSMTFLFIVSSLPSTIVTGYFYTDIIQLEAGQMIINLVDGFQFSYPAFNILILFSTNKLFADEIKEWISTKRTSMVSTKHTKTIS